MNRGFASRFALVGLCTVYALVRFVGWVPRQNGPGIEASWGIMVHEAWHQGWIFGRDVVFTSGPYGFVFANLFHPETYYLTLMIQSGLTLLVVVSLWLLYSDFVANRFYTSALLLLTTEAMVTSREGFFYCAILLPLLTHGWPAGSRRVAGPHPEGSRRRLLLHAQIAAVALISLAKFSFLACGTIVVSALALDSLRHREFPAVVATFAASLLVLWLLAGQPISAIPDYVSTSMQLTSGYSSAMSLRGPPLEPSFYALASAGLCAGFVLLVRSGPQRASGFLAFALAAGLFLGFKAAYTRHDMHAWIGFSIVAPLGALISARVWTLGRDFRCRAAALSTAVGVLGLALAVSLRHDDLIHPYAHNRFEPTRVRDHAARFAAVVTGRFDVDRAWRETNDRLQERHPLARSRGSFDVYPYSQGLLIGHELTQRPRPVFQSYAAFSGDLLERNARHLETNGPRNVLFGLLPIDGRYPSLDDSLSWPVLLSHYRLVGSAPPFAQFRRARRPRPITMTPIATLTRSLGEVVELPRIEAGSLWAELRLRPTLLGRLIDLLHKPPEAVLWVHVGADVRRYRSVVEIMRAGFLLSPLIADLDDLAALASNRFDALASKRVERLRLSFEGTAASVAYEPDYELRLYRLELADEAPRNRIEAAVEPSAPPDPQHASPARGDRVAQETR